MRKTVTGTRAAVVYLTHSLAGLYTYWHGLRPHARCRAQSNSYAIAYARTRSQRAANTSFSSIEVLFQWRQPTNGPFSRSRHMLSKRIHHGFR